MLRVLETQVKPVKLRMKEKDKYLSAFINEKFRNAAARGSNNVIKPLYTFLFFLISIYLCFSLSVGFVFSAGGRLSPQVRKDNFGNPRSIFF